MSAFLCKKTKNKTKFWNNLSCVCFRGGTGNFFSKEKFFFPKRNKLKEINFFFLSANTKTRAFITHGGLNSLTEAVELGVPTICTPLFGDQYDNCRTGTQHGISLTMDVNIITSANLENYLRKILYDESYINKAKALAKTIATKPFNSVDRIIGYVNHALNNDVHELLDLPDRKLGFIQYYHVDYLLVLSVILFSFLFVVSKLVKNTLISPLLNVSNIKKKVE